MDILNFKKGVEMKRCTQCGRDNLSTNNFCYHCGGNIFTYHFNCPCGTILDTYFLYCINCGRKVDNGQS